MNKMLEFKLDDWVILKNIFVNISEIIDELVIECTSKDLKFKGIDRSHVCFFECEILKNIFDEYYLEKPLYLYVDINEFVKVLKRGKTKDKLILKADFEVIEIIFVNKNNRIFSITQIELDNDMKNLPSLDYSVEFECDFESIKNSLQDADLYSDRLTFNCEDEQLVLSCESGFGNYKNICELENSVNGSHSATYGLDWLFKIFNNKLSSDNFKIHMGDDYPMLIEFASEFVKLNYLLAPRLGD